MSWRRRKSLPSRLKPSNQLVVSMGRHKSICFNHIGRFCSITLRRGMDAGMDGNGSKELKTRAKQQETTDRQDQRVL